MQNFAVKVIVNLGKCIPMDLQRHLRHSTAGVNSPPNITYHCASPSLPCIWRTSTACVRRDE